MYNFTLQIITIVSLGIIVYLLTRALPRVPEKERVTQSSVGNFLNRKIGRHIPLEKLDARAHSLIEKILRKFKVLVMKTDNFVDDRIDQLKKTKKGNGDEKNIREHVELISGGPSREVLEDKASEDVFQDKENPL
jgi:hypothetical protein